MSHLVSARRLNRRDFLKVAGCSLAGSALAACQPAPPALPAVVQKPITQVELMPNLPEPFFMRDWRGVALGFDQLAFDFNAHGDYLPLIWRDRTHVNSARDTFGLPAYVGDTRQQGGNAHESITTQAAVLGATLCGLDKSNQNGQDWVAMLETYFNTANGLNLFLDTSAGVTGRSFWYELYPHVLCYALAGRYPANANLAQVMQITADRWHAACVVMGGTETAYPDFLYTAFDFVEMQPKFNGSWREPDAAAGIAWLQYMAWVRFGDEKYLQAADWGLQFLEHIERNPLYEVLLPFGAYLAVRMRAELGRSYDDQKLVNWCFDGGYYRFDWGVNVRRWGDYDCHGLAALRTQASGYAFAMNTFAFAGALAPIPRYDPGYARGIGKWLLNLANSARLFYANGLPEELQSSFFWKGDPEHVLAYEGLQEIGDGGQRPYATGDPIRMRWGKTDFGVYGSSHVGFLGSLLRPTADEHILQVDLLATDHYHRPAFPTYLYFNPYSEPRTVAIEVGAMPVDLYDTVQRRFVQRQVRGRANLDLAPDSAAVIVLVPAGGRAQWDGRRFSIDDTIVDFGVGAGAESSD